MGSAPFCNESTHTAYENTSSVITRRLCQSPPPTIYVQSRGRELGGRLLIHNQHFRRTTDWGWYLAGVLPCTPTLFLNIFEGLSGKNIANINKGNWFIAVSVVQGLLIVHPVLFLSSSFFSISASLTLRRGGTYPSDCRAKVGLHAKRVTSSVQGHIDRQALAITRLQWVLAPLFGNCPLVSFIKPTKISHWPELQFQWGSTDGVMNRVRVTVCAMVHGYG